MLGTLGKVAMGIMIAKGVGKAMGGSGGIGDLVGGLMGGNSSSNNQQGGGLGNLLNSLGGNSQSGASTGGGLGDLLSSALAGGETKAEPSDEQKAQIILKAMISAAKADGQIDAQEQANITKHIGDVTKEELDFVREEMQAPLDVQSVIDSVPSGMEQQVYMMSLLTINLDDKTEASYMDKLAKGLNITPEIANAIHQKLGVQELYS
jgi:uncharacterized membrane protein YebE (DUF533 family)